MKPRLIDTDDTNTQSHCGFSRSVEQYFNLKERTKRRERMAQKPMSTDEINKQMSSFFEKLGFANKSNLDQINQITK